MSNRQSDIYLRAFGMSGLQLRLDLEAVAQEANVSLFPVMPHQNVRKLQGYEQFEGEIRTQASAMSEYYEIFFCLEVSIRQLVSNTMSDAEGSDWWLSDRVPPEYRKNVEVLKRDEADSGMTLRSEDDLDYLTFGQLKELIVKNFDIFNAVLSSKRAVERIMTQLIQLRNPIAHCCPLAADEKERLELTVRDWFRVRS